MNKNNYEALIQLFVLWNEQFTDNEFFAEEVIKLIGSDYNEASEHIYDKNTKWDDLLLNQQKQIKVMGK